MEVAVIGCGDVGLVTATCLASVGHSVRAVENDPRKLRSLQDCHCPIFELGLAELMSEQCASGQLRFSSDIKSALDEAQVVFLAVGDRGRTCVIAVRVGNYSDRCLRPAELIT
ncbi:MAG: 3-hydroxyacyl-CoA dehydrogenase NAD-binding domain-containing protein [Planctomycetota bacterium]|nr:3-hydroxyacyl-CoA dehydrogenase NAD-binding domain-containing protein [Planctomycetota bacterium]